MKHSSVTRSMVNPDSCTFQNLTFSVHVPNKVASQKNLIIQAGRTDLIPTHSSRFCLTQQFPTNPLCKSPSAADAVGDLQMFFFEKKVWSRSGGGGQHPDKHIFGEIWWRIWEPKIHFILVGSFLSFQRDFDVWNLCHLLWSFGMDPESTLNMLPTQKSIQELTLMVV